MMTTQHRMRRSWIVRLVVGLLIFLGLLVIGGITYEALADRSARRNYPPPGELVDVGDYRLHLHVMGERQGRPTVILEHGGMSMSAQWGWVQPELANYTQVVAYDRPGLGWSDPSPRRLDAREAVQDLYVALQQLGIEGPYLLVGHSMGGLMVRIFAHTYPDAVAGLVLVDPREENWNELRSADEVAMDPSFFRLIGVASRLGVVRLSGMAAQDAQGLPPQQFNQAVALTASHRHLKGMRGEALLADSATLLLRNGGNLNNIPLVVLSATEPDGALDARQRQLLTTWHTDLANQSTQGNYRTVAGAGHITIVTAREYGDIVTSTVLELLETPLAVDD